MMRNTVTTLLAASVLAMPSLAHAQAPRVQDRGVQPPPRVVERQRTRVEQRDNRVEQTERLTHAFKIGRSGELLISNMSGDITVTEGGGTEVQIEAIKRARARTAELAQAALPMMRVVFAERAGRAEATTVWQRERGNERDNVGVSVTYHVTAPEGTRITAKSMSGSIRITGIKGELSASSMSGHVAILDATRVASATSMSGNVEVGDLRSETATELSSTSGNVIVRHSRVPRLELNSISGNVVLDDVQVERVRAQSVSGNVTFASPLARGGRYNLSSLSGNVRVDIMGGSGFEVDANSTSGTVHSGFELKERTAGTSAPSRGGRTRRLRGIHGDGSALLDITSFSGNVTILKK
jgi:Ni/Co efflux regulator RcnB